MEGDGRDLRANELAEMLSLLRTALGSKRYTVQVMPDPDRWEVIRAEDGECELTIYVAAAPASIEALRDAITEADHMLRHSIPVHVEDVLAVLDTALLRSQKDVADPLADPQRKGTE
jgi:hypothetical protein